MKTLVVVIAVLGEWQGEMKDKFRENFEIIRSDLAHVLESSPRLSR